MFEDLHMNFNADPAVIDAFAENHRCGSILQESAWASVKNNWKHYFVTMDRKGEVIASAVILSRSAAAGFGMFYIPRGPVMDYHDSEAVWYFFQELKKFAKKKRAIMIKFDPLVPYSSVYNDQIEYEGRNTDVIALMKSMGCVYHGLTMGFDETAQPRTQAVIDLSENVKINKKLKYYLSHAEKRGVKVRRMQAEGTELLSRMLSKTAARKNISLRNKEYFDNLMAVYGDHANISVAYIDIRETETHEKQRKAQLEKSLENPQYKDAKKAEIREQISSIDNELQLLEGLAEKYGDTAVISAALIVRSEKYSELFYAGMDEELNTYRSNSSFNDAIQWAKENGCRYCDMGGVEGTLDDSLTAYKKIYNPHFESYIGEFDLPVYGMLYKAADALLPAVRKINVARALKKQ